MARPARSAQIRSSNRGEEQASAPRSLRERVLAGVRGEPLASAKGPRRRRPRALLAPALALAVGIAAGALWMGVLSPGGARTGRDATRRFQASLQTFDSHAELSVSGMPEPPVGEVYEVWLVRSGSSTPDPTDALFTVSRQGSATVEVPGGGARDVSEVLVTSEPLGGSSVPTSPAVLRVRSPGAR